MIISAQVLTHRVGSMSMLALIYSEILKMLRIWGLLKFDVEVSSPNDSYGSPRGYLKQKITESDQQHIVTTEYLLLKVAPVFYVEIFTCRFIYYFCIFIVSFVPLSKNVIGVKY